MLYTDNNPLTYVLKTATLNAVGQQWVAELADFNFTIKYRPQKANVDADDISRMPVNFDSYMSQCTQSVFQEVVRATEQGILVQQEELSPLFSSVSFNTLQEQMGAETLPNTVQPLSRDVIKTAQQEDLVIGKIYDHKMRNERPCGQEIKNESIDVKALVREWNRL